MTSDTPITNNPAEQKTKEAKTTDHNIIPPITKKYAAYVKEAEAEREVDPRADDKTTDTESKDRGPGVGGD
ncbi:hypothetical protein I862_00105 [endosymbiont of Acanthamoeba sp. UWC8]|uniref:hypothetical protein n=1 Tax=endosymbiont of Acanthamoeba sp. UWC8 TaxID=86106 RepID=UPI0004D0C333|nr:hypothetical protein [endosymbiont of Acanthamoeba sp. UWC8]AIF80586.1 hypothetical protein I862_00105 [endosymbiont of Acanthamoeba sp. UWC8]